MPGTDEKVYEIKMTCYAVPEAPCGSWIDVRKVIVDDRDNNNEGYHATFCHRVLSMLTSCLQAYAERKKTDDELKMTDEIAIDLCRQCVFFTQWVADPRSFHNCNDDRTMFDFELSTYTYDQKKITIGIKCINRIPKKTPEEIHEEEIHAFAEIKQELRAEIRKITEMKNKSLNDRLAELRGLVQSVREQVNGTQKKNKYEKYEDDINFAELDQTGALYDEKYLVRLRGRIDETVVDIINDKDITINEKNDILDQIIWHAENPHG